MAIHFNHTILSARKPGVGDLPGRDAGPPRAHTVGAVPHGHDGERRKPRLHEYRTRDHPAALRVPDQRIRNSTRFSPASANGTFPIGLTPGRRSRARSTTMMVGAASISRTPTATCLRLSPGLTAAAAGIRDAF